MCVYCRYILFAFKRFVTKETDPFFQIYHFGDKYFEDPIMHMQRGFEISLTPGSSSPYVQLFGYFDLFYAWSEGINYPRLSRRKYIRKSFIAQIYRIIYWFAQVDLVQRLRSVFSFAQKASRPFEQQPTSFPFSNKEKKGKLLVQDHKKWNSSEIRRRWNNKISSSAKIILCRKLC